MFSNYVSVIVGDLEIHLQLKSSFLIRLEISLYGFLAVVLLFLRETLFSGVGPGCHGLSVGTFCPSPYCSDLTPTQQQAFLHLPSGCSPNPLVPNSPVRWQAPLPHGWHSLPKSPAPLFPGSIPTGDILLLMSLWAPGLQGSILAGLWSASGSASLLLPPLGSSFSAQNSPHLLCFWHSGFSLLLSRSLLSLPHSLRLHPLATDS